MSGRRLVRSTLLLTLGLSIAANIGHTILADSQVPVWLRMIGAVWWPLAVFLAVEIFFRVQLSGTVLHRFAQALVLAPSLVAAITSYEHMHFMLLAMGEKPFIAIIGPGAVDAFMIGCTLILLFTRDAETLTTAAREVRLAMVNTWLDAADVDVDALVGRWVDTPAPVSPAPIAEVERRVQALMDSGRSVMTHTEVERAAKPRTGTEYRLKELLEDPQLKANDSTMRRYATVARALREDPAAPVPANLAGKVRPELVTVIRRWAETGRAYV